MRSDLVLIRISSDERCAFEECAKADEARLSTWCRAMLRLASGLDDIEKPKASKPSRTVEKEIPSVQPEKAKENPSVQQVDSSRCAGGVHCPMFPVVERGDKWYCEFHSTKKG